MPVQSFVAPLEKFDSDLWGFHIEVPAHIAASFLKTSGRRVICTLENSLEVHCAIMQWSGGKHFININRGNREKLGIELGHPVHASLEPDESKYGLPMSEEFEEVLRQYPEAEVRFHRLTPGLQRSLIYFSDNVKSSNIKVRRAIVVMEHLMKHSGTVDFKLLTAEIKEANQLAKRG